MKTIPIFTLALMVLIIAGCSSGKDSSNGDDPGNNEDPKELITGDESRDKEKLRAMESKILSIVDGSTCSEGSTTCKVVAFGSKPCGGPWKYLAYNSTDVNEPALLEQITRYNQMEFEMNQAYGYMSDCEFITEPEVKCVDGKCQTQ